MAGLTQTMEMVIASFKKLPGVGPRTAERFAFFLLTQPTQVSQELAQSIQKLKLTTRFCRNCFNLSDQDLCGICQDSSRDASVICVMEHPRSIIAFEKSGGYKGTYHCLLGALSPLDGIGPKDLKIEALKNRLKTGKVKELILATDSDMEGEATALYLSKELRRVDGLTITRLAAGLPMGSSIEFSDQVTLARALEGRRSV